ncbi:MAG: hypothetical protein ABH876_00940 [Patescibacteria group bacterium]|nr:hypothetical protein [Patescibacteria group bacterium]MBU1876924.1 hypothetical protein [Patescibacteria group bacterium]
MKRIIFRKYFLIGLIFGFLLCGQFVLACEEGSVQECGDCGLEYCDNCQINPETEEEICDWSGLCEEPPKPDTEQTINWEEYRCQGEENKCGEQYIETTIWNQDQTRNVTCEVHGTWTTGNWSDSGDPYYDSPFISEYCDLDWQLCSGGTEWTEILSERQCSCAGQCLDIPANPRYYDNPNYPINPYNPEVSKDSNNIFLPVKLDWDDVQYWQTSPDGPKSYKTTVKSTTKGDYSKVSTQSEYNYTQDPNGGVCLLKSNFTHQWQVQACCGADGSNCGSQSNWSFTTNSAPEPVTPADPDWKNEEGIAQNVGIPVVLDWCDVNIANSYIIQIYKDSELRHVTGVKKINGVLTSSIEIKNFEVFTGLTNYSWEVSSCFNENGTGCADFSQKWSFKTQEMEITPPKLLEPFYNPNKPNEIPFVNLSNSLEWQRTENEGLWARSYYFEIKKGNEIIVPSTLTTQYIVPFVDIWNSLELNEAYNWHVKSCYSEDGTDCSNFGDSWYFKTTGAKPILNYPNNNANDILIPVNFDWQDVSGAASYIYEIAIDSGFTNIVIPEAQRVVEKSEVLADYPFLKMLTDYWWRVKTCADKEGNICGDWATPQNFKTFKLETPTNPSPENGTDFNTSDNYLSWDPVLGGKFYQYRIYYGGVEKIPPTIVSTNSAFLSTGQLELGSHSWYVRSCLDKDCQETGDWAGPWSFNLVQPTPIGKAGFVPCGGIIDYPETPWNEREQCGIQHIFIMLKNILDFLLWRLSLLVLVSLTILTAVIFYFSLGSTNTIINIKSIWKSAGIGYGIIFFAWIFINLILKFLGYTVDWWIITF